MKIQIKHRYTNEVLFEHEQENNTFKLTVEEAVRQKVNLSFANLSGAYLYGAYLYGANLSFTNLSEANLSGANLSRAYLSEANLSEANLSRAYLYGANLSRADLSEADLSEADLRFANLYGAYLYRANLSYTDLRKAKLEEDIEISDSTRNFLSVGPIGSRDATLLAFSTNKGLYLKTGCFSGLEEAFRERLQKTHAEGSEHREEYETALNSAKTILKVWKSPAQKQDL